MPAELARREAPQRSVRAERGRDSLPRHLDLIRTSAKGSFSFTEGSCGNCIPEFGFRAGCAFRFEPVWESVDRNPASEWDMLSFCGPWRKLRPRSRAQNGMRFPVEALNGKYIPVSCEKTGHAFRRLLPTCVHISVHQLVPVRPRHSSRFCTTLQTVRSSVRTRGYTQNYTFPMQYDAGSACTIRRGQ